MKNLYINFVDRIVMETGYDWDYVADEYNKAMALGVKSIDFFDYIVDGRLFKEV